jgi:hypothetical protein
LTSGGGYTSLLDQREEGIRGRGRQGRTSVKAAGAQRPLPSARHRRSCAPAREQQALSSTQGFSWVLFNPLGGWRRVPGRAFQDERQRNERGRRPGRRSRRIVAGSRKPYRHGCDPAPCHARARARSAAPGLLPWLLPACWGSWPASWNSAAYPRLCTVHRAARPLSVFASLHLSA